MANPNIEKRFTVTVPAIDKTHVVTVLESKAYTVSENSSKAFTITVTG
jgi:hypothetical protein